MIYWVDAHQLPHQLAKWLSDTFKVEAYALRDLNLRDAEDSEIFEKILTTLVTSRGDIAMFYQKLNLKILCNERLTS